MSQIRTKATSFCFFVEHYVNREQAWENYFPDVAKKISIDVT